MKKNAKNEPSQTSIKIFFYDRQNKTIKPNATEKIRAFWIFNATRPTLTHVNEFRLKNLKFNVPGLSIGKEIVSGEKHIVKVDTFLPTANLIVKNSNSYDIVLNHGDPLGEITRGTFGPYPCAVFNLNMKNNQLTINYLQKSGWESTFFDNFDVFNDTSVPELAGKYKKLNQYSIRVLDILKWPKFAVLFIFSTEDEANICLNVIFPKTLPKDMELSNLKIKIHIMPDAQNKKDLIKEKIETQGFADFSCKQRILSDPVDPWCNRCRKIGHYSLKCSNPGQKSVIENSQSPYQQRQSVRI